MSNRKPGLKITKSFLLFILIGFIAVLQPVAAALTGVMLFDPSCEKFTEIQTVKKNGSTMVSFRKTFENFGMSVTWNEHTRTSRAAKDNLTVSVKIDSRDAYINDSKVVMSAPAVIINKTTYVPLDFIRSIPGIVSSGKISSNNLKIWDKNVFIKHHGWTQLCEGLIAHAGGGLYRQDEKGEKISVKYTNSREALENSYKNGHRVFEMDFLLTYDGKLAAVHDWERVGGKKTSEEWKTVKIYDTYTSMLIENVYEFMLEYPDTFLVTDTKSFFYGDKDITHQFEQLVSVAKDIDESLLKRVIPQVYDQNCYDIMMDVYPFESVIYTLYESPDTNKEVVDFVAKHKNIKVITMEWYRYTEEFYNDLTALSKYIYFFTINVPKEIETFRSWGVHGFYTDYINPK